MILNNKNAEGVKFEYLSKDISITDALIDIFYNETLKEDEKEILKVAFSKNLKQDELDNLLKIWDIEVKGANKSLMLAYIMKLHPDMKFREYEEPRLKGLLKYFHFRNLNIISHYSKIVKALNDSGITPLILKGGAMRHLRPSLPRIMGDIDFLVKEKDFMKSANIAVSLGYTYNKIDIHSIDIHKNDGSKDGIVDIHRFIYMNTGYEKSIVNDLFSRAREENVFKTRTLVPSNEDLAFIVLVNLVRNMRDNTSQEGLIYSIFDFAYLISKEDFHWNIIKENARKTHSEIHIAFAIKFIEKISDNIIPEQIKEELFLDKNAEDYSRCVLFKRFYIDEIRTKCRAMKVKDFFSGKYSILDYLRLKPKYFYLKLLRDHPLLIKLLIKDLLGEKE